MDKSEELLSCYFCFLIGETVLPLTKLNARRPVCPPSSSKERSLLLRLGEYCAHNEILISVVIVGWAKGTGREVGEEEEEVIVKPKTFCKLCPDNNYNASLIIEKLTHKRVFIAQFIGQLKTRLVGSILV